MLTNMKISITADTIVDEARIATYGAVIEIENKDVSFYARQSDKPLCKVHRDVVRKDQAAFEDFAYALQEQVEDPAK